MGYREVVFLEILYNVPTYLELAMGKHEVARKETYLRPVISSRAAERSCLEDGDAGFVATPLLIVTSLLLFFFKDSSSLVRASNARERASALASTSAMEFCSYTDSLDVKPVRHQEKAYKCVRLPQRRYLGVVCFTFLVFFKQRLKSRDLFIVPRSVARCPLRDFRNSRREIATGAIGH